MPATTHRPDGPTELSIDVFDEDGRIVDTIYVTEITGRATSPSREGRITRPQHLRRGG